MGARRRAREHALKMLYQSDLAGGTPADVMATHWSLEEESEEVVRGFAERLLRTVLADKEAIDTLISDVSTNWRIERIGTIDRNILRLAIGEMRNDSETPAAVVIDEAVELAREYGETESRAFVNGILEAVRRKLSSAP